MKIALSLLANHLVSSLAAKATVIDTTGSFNVRQFHGAIARSHAHNEDGMAFATKVLGRLEIMRVFDFVGLTEGVAELRADLERVPKGTVGDSEGEEDESLEGPPRHDANGVNNFLLIDDLTHVAGPLLKNNHTAGQALLTSFIRSLGHMSRAHKIDIVMQNSLQDFPNHNSSDAPSIFASCTARPALGKTLPFLIDVQLLVHREPATVASAKIVYGGRSAGKGGVDWVGVVEIVQDRNGDRVGRWAPFKIAVDGTLEDLD